MSNVEMSVTEKFEYIVEDPFYSRIHNCMVKVDDYGNMFAETRPNSSEWELHFEGLSDGMINVLYAQWLDHQKYEQNFLGDVHG